MTLSPYSGSLLRLAITTIAVMAVFAGVVAFWEGSLALVRLPPGIHADAHRPGAR